MSPLLVLSCSEVKRPLDQRAWVPFADLYDGPMWRQVRAAGFPLERVAALSAGYGFLEPGSCVHWYDTRMARRRDERATGHASVIRHIQHAAGMLAPGGRLVAICANGPRQRDTLQPIASEWIDLPAGSFASQGTQVNAAIVVIDRAAEAIAGAGAADKQLPLF